uniref:Reverse transcriptase-rnase h-integrase n=1 Tax=Moniliophthora roreri TaxID=221103 RepID=A0A0W0G4M2_MONRR
MSNATAAASSSSASSSQSARVPSPVPTVLGEGQYGENITYPNGLKPNPSQLLHLFNSEQLEPCVKSLFFLRTQRKLFERIVESCSLEIANQVMYACNYQLGLTGPVTIPGRCQNTLIPSPSASSTNSDDKLMGTGIPVPTSMTLGVSSPDSLPNPWSTKHNSPPLPIPPPNLTTPSFILTPLPILTSSLRSSQSTLPDHPNLDLRPPLTPKVFRRLKPQFHWKVEHIPVVGGEVIPRESEDVVEDEEQENQIPENNDDPPMPSLRNLTLAPTPMMQLVDHISALCADWNAISPDIAHSTCATNASKLNLDIHLATALSNEGLATLRTKGLIQAQTLCRMIAVMTMSPTKISEENAEALTEAYDRDAQLLFVGADPQKARLLSVEEQEAMGWQLTFDVLATPRLGMVDEMPDMSYDYDTELYGDGES